MKTPHEFYQMTIGKYIDVDGYYGAQCWDLWAYYCKVQEVPIFNTSITGYVKDIWNTRSTSGILNYYDAIAPNKMQDGDWAIWDNTPKVAPDSHIAMFRKDNGNGTGIFLGQNQVVGNMSATQINISYTGILGAFRLKKKPTPGPVSPTPQHKIAYRSHVQGYGWMQVCFDGQTSGTTGKGLRLEAILIDARMLPKGKTIKAKAHIQSKGWVDYGVINHDTVIGTVNKKLRLEAICLDGPIKYRVHIEGTGWTQWTKADGVSTLGSVGMSKRIEAIQIEMI